MPNPTKKININVRKPQEVLKRGMEGQICIPRSSQQSGSTSFLHLVYGNTSGKQVSGIQVADAKREKFPVDSPHDIQSRCVIPRIQRGIKVCRQYNVTEAHYKFVVNAT